MYIDQDRLSGVPDFSSLNHPLTSADRLVVRDGHFCRSGDAARRSPRWRIQRPRPGSLPVLQDAIAKDPANDVRRRALSALSQVPQNEGTPLLLKLARSNNATVQKEAMRCLGRSKDPRATQFFQEILLK